MQTKQCAYFARYSELRECQVNQLGALSLPLCVPNLSIIQPVPLGYRIHTIYTAGSGWRQWDSYETKLSDTGDLINDFITFYIYL